MRSDRRAAGVLLRAFERFALAACALGAANAAAAAQPSASAVVVDRAVMRFWAPETGGVSSPHFVYERLLSFEARLEALSDLDRRDASVSFRDRHVTNALERHIAETLLSGLHIDPEPKEAEIVRQMQAARARLLERIGGEAVLQEAARAEGIGARDVLGLLRRQALASLYLDRMVAPMLEPSDAELRTLHRTRNTPFRDLPFERIEPGLRRWYVAERLGAALLSFYQNARGRLVFATLAPLPAGASIAD
jgi:hypothetical protein